VLAAAAAVALAVWALARLLGVESTVGKGNDASQVGAADVLVAVVVAGLAAGRVQTLLARVGPLDGGHLSGVPRCPSRSSGRPGLPMARRASC
jgi:hypothetical protein